MVDPFGTKPWRLTFSLQGAAKAILATTIRAGGGRAQTEPTPDEVRAAFDALPEDRKELVRVAGRAVFAFHALSGESLSDHEALLTVLAGCTTWDRWEQRGGGCHWHGDLWPTPEFECRRDGCEGWCGDNEANVLWCLEAINTEGRVVRVDETLGDDVFTEDTAIAVCDTCGREVTLAEVRETPQGRRRLASGPLRESVLAPWRELGLLEAIEPPADDGE